MAGGCADQWVLQPEPAPPPWGQGGLEGQGEVTDINSSSFPEGKGMGKAE